MSMDITSRILYYYLPLPKDVITNILLYDRKYIMRKGKLTTINKLNKKDPRYKILEDKRPLIFVGKIGRTTLNNSITVYSNIINKNVFEQYEYIYKSIQMYKHF